MSKWKKSPESLIKDFETVREMLNLEPRKMFGYPCAFVNGNLFMGLHEDNWIVRLSEEDREKLTKKGWKNFEPMKGRVMREYLAFPKRIKPAEKKKWVEKSFAFAKTLPKKKKK